MKLITNAWADINGSTADNRRTVFFWGTESLAETECSTGEPCCLSGDDRRRHFFFEEDKFACMKICSAIPVVSNVHTVWALPVCLPQSYDIKRRICRGFGQKSSRRTLLGNYPKPEDTYQMLDFSYVVRFLGIIFLREIGKNRVVLTSINK